MKKIGELLLEKKIITPEQLAFALKAQESEKRFIGHILVDKGWITYEQLLINLSEQYHIPFIRLANAEISKEALDAVPLKVAIRHRVMPIRLDGTKLTVAIANPQDVRVLDELRLALHQKFTLEIVLSTEQDIHKAIEKRYGIAAETVQGILTKKDQESVKSFQAQEVIENIQDNDESASVIKLINQILLEADERGATDIHFEPYRGSIRLRYRLDGILKLVETPPSISSLFPAMISRIKVLSGLNLVERRAPQDGRASIKVGDRRIDLRVSIIPTLTGESVVIRILPSQMLLDLQQLGFRGDGLAYLDEMIQKPYGLIFVTGPTGSGKSTTLYACIKRINREDRKIITVEDPVEYEVEGITQIQTNPKVGLTFAAGLRSMLRHDPDVMMVGEVRDAETAELAIRIALTGHLVFSTLHTNDAATGISRLIDIGIDPFLVASAARCFVAQRLVRLICVQCKKQEKSDFPGVEKAYRGTGCEACQQTGFKGRTAIYEILKVTPEIRKMVLQRVSSDAIRDKAVEQGMKLLYEDGLDKVREGLITIEEVIRVTTKDE